MFGPIAPRSLPQPGHRYDVAVVGAGLVGCELAWRLARGGQDVLLVTQALDTLGNVFQPEVPAVFPEGSLMAGALERAAPRRDTWAVHRRAKEQIEAASGIHLLQSCVRGLRAGDPHELATWEGPGLRAAVVVLATGSFLRARLTLGAVTEAAGRLSEVAYDFLADDLVAQGVALQESETVAEGGEGAPAYTVRHQVFDLSELDGPRLRRFERVYALGRCCPGDWTYAGCVEAAAQLADELLEMIS